jgi:hypothetical protein
MALDDTDRTVVWRRRETPVGREPLPGDPVVEPVRAGDPTVNVNQPTSAYQPAPTYAPVVGPTATQLAVWRAQRIIYYIFGVIEAIILIRFILKLLAANTGSAFTQIVYNVSWVFVFPFNGVVPNFSSGGTVFEWFSLIALVVYALVSLGLARLIALLI